MAELQRLFTVDHNILESNIQLFQSYARTTRHTLLILCICIVVVLCTNVCIVAAAADDRVDWLLIPVIIGVSAVGVLLFTLIKSVGNKWAKVFDKGQYISMILGVFLAVLGAATSLVFFAPTTNSTVRVTTLATCPLILVGGVLCTVCFVALNKYTRREGKIANHIRRT